MHLTTKAHVLANLSDAHWRLMNLDGKTETDWELIDLIGLAMAKLQKVKPETAEGVAAREPAKGGES